MKKSYLICGSASGKDFMKVLAKKKNGFDVLITRFRANNWTVEKREFLPKSVFDTCMRVNYLKEIEG